MSETWGGIQLKYAKPMHENNQTRMAKDILITAPTTKVNRCDKHAYQIIA